MPFVGKHARTGERIDIWRIEQPRRVFAPGDVVCPLCEGVLYVKDGMVRVKHFAHQARRISPLAMLESIDHLLGKQYIAESLRLELAGYAIAEVEYEVPLPEAGRVADVLGRSLMGGAWRMSVNWRALRQESCGNGRRRMHERGSTSSGGLEGGRPQRKISHRAASKGVSLPAELTHSGQEIGGYNTALVRAKARCSMATRSFLSDPISRRAPTPTSFRTAVWD